MQRHMEERHGEEVRCYQCPVCRKYSKRKDAVQTHLRNQHPHETVKISPPERRTRTEFDLNALRRTPVKKSKDTPLSSESSDEDDAESVQSMDSVADRVRERRRDAGDLRKDLEISDETSTESSDSEEDERRTSRKNTPRALNRRLEEIGEPLKKERDSSPKASRREHGSPRSPTKRKMATQEGSPKKRKTETKSSKEPESAERAGTPTPDSTAEIEPSWKGSPKKTKPSTKSSTKKIAEEASREARESAPTKDQKKSRSRSTSRSPERRQKDAKRSPTQRRRSRSRDRRPSNTKRSRSRSPARRRSRSKSPRRGRSPSKKSSPTSRKSPTRQVTPEMPGHRGSRTGSTDSRRSFPDTDRMIRQIDRHYQTARAQYERTPTRSYPDAAPIVRDRSGNRGIIPRPTPSYRLAGSVDLGGTLTPTQLIRTDLGAGDIQCYVPALPHPAPQQINVYHGLELHSPHEMDQNRYIYVTVPEVWHGPYGPVTSHRVIRVEDMRINDPRLRFGFYVPPQWALNPQAPVEALPIRRRGNTPAPATPTRLAPPQAPPQAPQHYEEFGSRRY